MTRNLVLSSIIILIISSCNNQGGNSSVNNPTLDIEKIKQFEWVIGSWINNMPNGLLYESWTKTNDTVYSGKSFMIVKNDTVIYEKILMELKAGDLFYTPTVSNQNKNISISFKLSSNTNREFVFENKEHDYPQRIIYKNPTTDSLFAQIEGIIKGKYHREEFTMKRIKL